MKTLLTLLFCLLTVPAFAQTASKIPSITIGGRTFTDMANLKILRSAHSSAAGYSNFFEDGGSTVYTPSGSNNFRVLAVKLHSAGAANCINLLYGDDFANDGIDEAVPTTPVYEMGLVSTFYPFCAVAVGSPDWAKAEYSINFLILNGKYLSSKISGAVLMYITVYGYEEAP